MFPVQLSVAEYSTQNNKKLGGCLIRIYEISSILQGFLTCTLIFQYFLDR